MLLWSAQPLPPQRHTQLVRGDFIALVLSFISSMFFVVVFLFRLQILTSPSDEIHARAAHQCSIAGGTTKASAIIRKVTQLCSQH